MRRFLMTNNALIYRPPSKWPVVGAFAAAIIFHLCAVALASHRATPSTDASPIVTGEVPALVDLEPAPAPPDPEELPLPLPPPDSSAPEFVEPTPAPSIGRNQRPIHPVRPARASSAVTFARTLTLSAPRPDYPYEARRRNITGSGVVTLTVNEATGSVVAAEMEQTIGNPILDQSALGALRRWRFKIGTPSRVRVPITFTITGAAF
jgi:periplasmic protein TonB